MMNTLPEGFLDRIPAFIAKLWVLVDDPSTDSVISWTDHGTTFTIHDQAKFSKVILPKYFKHANVASFVRQLNMYYFRKRVSLKSNLTEESCTFYHPCFLRNGPGLLVEIQRKSPKISTVSQDPEGLESVIYAMRVFNSAHCRLVSEFRQLKQMRKSIRQQLAEISLSLAHGAVPAHNNVNKTKDITSDVAVDDRTEDRSCDLSKTEQNIQTGVADKIRESVRLLQEMKEQLVRQHKLYVQELRVSLQARQTLARLEEEDWKVRMQAAEQQLANHELEHVVLSKQLEYQRACNAEKKANTIVRPGSSPIAGQK